MLDAWCTSPDEHTVARGRMPLALLLTGCLPLVAACGTSATAGEGAATRLEQNVAEVHRRALAERAAEPASRDQAAADRLGRAVSRGNATVVVTASTTPLGVEVVTTVGVRDEAGGARPTSRPRLAHAYGRARRPAPPQALPANAAG